MALPSTSLRQCCALTSLMLILGGCDLLGDPPVSPPSTQDMSTSPADMATLPAQDMSPPEEMAAQDLAIAVDQAPEVPWVLSTHEKRVKLNLPLSLPFSLGATTIPLVIDDRTGIDLREMHPLGWDLRVFDEQGTPLSFELEPNGTNETQGWRLWFRTKEITPGLSFWLYYGHPFAKSQPPEDAAKTWGPEYTRVFHGTFDNSTLLDATRLQDHGDLVTYPTDDPEGGVPVTQLGRADVGTSLLFQGHRHIELPSTESIEKDSLLNITAENALVYFIVLNPAEQQDASEKMSLVDRQSSCRGHNFFFNPTGQVFWDIFGSDTSKPVCQDSSFSLSRILPNSPQDYMTAVGWNVLMFQAEKSTGLQQVWTKPGDPLPKKPEDQPSSASLTDLQSLTTDTDKPTFIGCPHFCKTIGQNQPTPEMQAARRFKRRFKGSIDEIHILNTVRSKDWFFLQQLALEGNLITFSPPESRSSE